MTGGLNNCDILGKPKSIILLSFILQKKFAMQMKIQTDTNLEDKIIFSEEIILKFMRNTAEKICDMTNMTFIGLNFANDSIRNIFVCGEIRIIMCRLSTHESTRIL